MRALGCLLAVACILSACNAPRDVTHAYTVTGRDLGYRRFVEIDDYDGKVSFLGPHSIKKREVANPQGRYQERITFGDGTVFLYSKHSAALSDSAVRSLRMDAGGGEFLRSRGIEFDGTKVRTTGAYAYFVGSSAQWVCVAFRAVLSIREEAYGTDCWPSSSKSEAQAEKWLLQIARDAKFDDGAANRVMIAERSARRKSAPAVPPSPGAPAPPLAPQADPVPAVAPATPSSPIKPRLPNADGPMTFTYYRFCAGIACPAVIVARGQIAADTPAKLTTLLAGLQQKAPLPVFLDSPGGSMTGGLELGRVIRGSNLTTVIGQITGEDDQGRPVVIDSQVGCASACAWAYLGGTVRRFGEGARYGLHQFYAPATNNVGDLGLVQQAVAELNNYVREMGGDVRLVDVALKTPRSTMRWLDAGDAGRLLVTTR